jgi:hypothetical protein
MVSLFLQFLAKNAQVHPNASIFCFDSLAGAFLGCSDTHKSRFLKTRRGTCVSKNARHFLALSLPPDSLMTPSDQRRHSHRPQLHLRFSPKSTRFLRRPCLKEAFVPLCKLLRSDTPATYRKLLWPRQLIHHY